MDYKREDLTIPPLARVKGVDRRNNKNLKQPLHNESILQVLPGLPCEGFHLTSGIPRTEACRVL